MISSKTESTHRNRLQPGVFFWLMVAVTTAIKILFAGLVPLTGDEALFAYWAEELDYGYFDHPPVAGWLPWATFAVSKSLIMLRLPAALLTSGVAIAIYGLLRPYGEEKAALSAVLLLIAPANLLLGIVHSTDVGLMFFSVLAGIAYFRASNSPTGTPYYTLTGVLLGLGFLAKYFIALLGFALLAHTLWRPSWRKIRGLGIILVSALPFVAVNLWWNYNHCWANLMHNFVNRVEDADVSLVTTPLAFGASIAYLALPWVPALGKRSTPDRSNIPWNDEDSRLLFFAWLVLVPLGIFAAALFFKDVRVHWLLSFYPFAFVVLTPYLTLPQLLRCLKFTVILSSLHLALTGLVLGTYDLILDKDSALYRSAVSEIHHRELSQRLQPYREQRYQLFTTSAPFSSILSFYLDADVGLFGGRSFRGRQDDLRRNFRQLNGHNFLILFRKEPELERYARYFRNAEVITLPIADTQLFALIGQRFRYPRYRHEVISQVIRDYYAIPEWLPMGSCYIFDTYTMPGNE